MKVSYLGLLEEAQDRARKAEESLQKHVYDSLSQEEEDKQYIQELQEHVESAGLARAALEESVQASNRRLRHAEDQLQHVKSDRQLISKELLHMKSKYAETEEAESSGGLPIGTLRQRTTGEADEREAIDDQIQALREELDGLQQS